VSGIPRWPSRDPIGEIGHETVELNFDYEKSTYLRSLKAELAYYSATLRGRWNKAFQKELTKDEIQELLNDTEYVQDINKYFAGSGAIGSGFSNMLTEFPSSYCFVENNPINLIDILGNEPIGGSGTNYRPDPFGHGTHSNGAPVDPHIDATDKNGNKNRYNPDGSGRDGAGKVPKKDKSAFEKAKKKASRNLGKMSEAPTRRDAFIFPANASRIYASRLLRPSPCGKGRTSSVIITNYGIWKLLLGNLIS